MKFWKWFFLGNGAGSGWARFLNRWIILHIGLGIALSWLTPITTQQAANTVLLPLAGVLIGLCFAWGGNAQALLQTEELEKLGEHHPGGFAEYLHVYQTAIFVVLLTLCLWGMAGLGLYEHKCFFKAYGIPYYGIRAVLFGLAAIAVRECWQVVLGAQTMINARYEIKRGGEGFASEKHGEPRN